MLFTEIVDTKGGRILKRYIRSAQSLEIDIDSLQDWTNFVNSRYRPAMVGQGPEVMDSLSERGKFNLNMSDNALQQIIEAYDNNDDKMSDFTYYLKLWARPSCYKRIINRMYNMLPRYYTTVPAFRASREILEHLASLAASTRNMIEYPITVEQRPSSVIIYLDISKTVLRNTTADEFYDVVAPYIEELNTIPEFCLLTSIDGLMRKFEMYHTSLVKSDSVYNYIKGKSLYIQIVPAKPYPYRI